MIKSDKCKSNPTCNSCKACMKGAPYNMCCRDECGEHEFCRGCYFRHKIAEMEKRKKHDIEYIKWDGENTESVIDFLGLDHSVMIMHHTQWDGVKSLYTHSTYVSLLIDNSISVFIGYYIVKNSDGKIHVYKSKDFEKKYRENIRISRKDNCKMIENHGMIRKYKTKPCEIEAIKWTGFNISEIKSFVGNQLICEKYDNDSDCVKMKIHTLEGDMEITEGDYIIKGLRGEFYPCKPDVFKRKYELADNLDDCKLGDNYRPYEIFKNLIVMKYAPEWESMIIELSSLVENFDLIGEINHNLFIYVETNGLPLLESTLFRKKFKVPSMVFSRYHNNTKIMYGNNYDDDVDKLIKINTNEETESVWIQREIKDINDYVNRIYGFIFGNETYPYKNDAISVIKIMIDHFSKYPNNGTTINMSIYGKERKHIM